MKKFFMLLAVAGFFSMSTISCGEAAKDGEKEGTEEKAPEGGDAEEGHEGHEH